MLHITNGDAVIDLWRQASLAGDLLAWRDVLHEGPVPEGLTLAELCKVRAHFHADAGAGGFDAILKEFRERDTQLAQVAEHEEVVLWFEHDLCDQLQLIQILDCFTNKDLRRTRLRLINVDRYLGLLDPSELCGLLDTRRPATEQDLTVAQRAWRAFTDPDPRAVASLLSEDLSPLLYLRNALHRLLQEYPAAGNGLTRTERQILQAVPAGKHNRGDVFAASQAREEAFFLGDVTFFRYLDQMLWADHPLLQERNEQLRLTPLGREVLEGRTDWLALHRVDRWIGGCHLESGRLIWRWDEEQQRLTLSTPGAAAS